MGYLSRKICRTIAFGLFFDSDCFFDYTRSVSLVHGFTHDKSVSCLFKSVSAAGLAQSVEPLTAEREVAGSIPGAGPILRVLKKPVSVKRRLLTADCRLRTRGKMQTAD